VRTDEGPVATAMIEVLEQLPHPPERIWALLGDPEIYPRLVREIAWTERLGGRQPGRGARYRMRFTEHTASAGIVEDEVAVLIHRPAEHLVMVSQRHADAHVSIRLDPHADGTRMQVVLALPDRSDRADGTMRRWIRHALTMLGHALDGTAPRAAPASVSARQSSFAVARTLTAAGVLKSRPDRALRGLAALQRWGPTIVGGYQASAARRPDEIALVGERGGTTFAELDARTTALAAGLAEYGVGEDKRVAVMARNHPGLVESMIACGKLGADVVLLNTGLSADQVAEVVQRDQPVLLLTDDEFAPLCHTLPPTLPRISVWSAGVGGRDIEKLIADAPTRPLRKVDRPGGIIVLTSGTTGTPKAARRRNPPGLGAAASMYSRLPLRSGDRIFVAAPVFHTWGLAALQLGMPINAALVMQRRFDAENTLRVIAHHRCTVLVAVPVMLQRILDLPARVRGRYDLSSLRIVASSGSAMSGEFVTRFMDTFGDLLHNVYGSTEVSWASVADPVDLRAAPTTAGRCPPGTRVAVVDPDGTPVPPGAAGEIAVGNDMLFEGYTSGEGSPMCGDLMRTGDRGYLDADGRLFVSGRDDDMIVSGGENVYPRPVEELLHTLPQVAEAAVVGVPDHEYGERFAAYLALRPGARLDAETVRRYVHDHLARYAVPRDVIFVRSLPRTTTGKVLKRVLAADRST